jgi:hypothetical protein
VHWSCTALAEPVSGSSRRKINTMGVPGPSPEGSWDPVEALEAARIRLGSRNKVPPTGRSVETHPLLSFSPTQPSL